MAEFTPQDATRPIADTPRGNSFADMPEGNKGSPFGPDVRMIEFEEDQPQVEPEPQAPERQVQQSAPQPQPNVAQELAQALYANEEARRQREAQEASTRAYNQRMDQALTPPPMPSNMEEVMADPEKFRAFMEERDAYTQRAALTASGPAAAVVQNLQAELASNRAALQGVYQQQKDSAWREARETLIDAGIEDPDAYYGHLETALRQNPNDYWNLSRNPEALVKGVGIIHQDMTGKAINPTRPFRGGRGGGRPNGRTQGGEVNLSAGAQAALAKAESVLKVKFGAAERREFAERIGR